MKNRKQLTDAMIRNLPPGEVYDSLVLGFGIRVGKNRRTFFVRARTNGQHARIKLGLYPAISLAEARATAREMLQAPSKAARRDTFGSIVEQYVSEPRTKALKSYGEIQRRLDKELLPIWRDRLVTDITRRDVIDMFRNKSRQAPVSANRTLELCCRVLNYAVDVEAVDNNPALGIRRNRETPRHRVLSAEEIALAWKAFDDMGEAGTILKAILLTGARPGEVVDVTPDEIDNKVWTIPAEKYKTGKPHTVPLSDAAADLLAQAPFEATTNAVSMQMRRRALDLPGGRATPHDLRRTAATRLAEDLEIAPHIVEAILGHASGTAVARTYNRSVLMPQRRAALEAWARHIEAIVSGATVPDNVVRLG